MKRVSILNKMTHKSPLGEQGVLSGNKGKVAKTLYMSLSLTSLVDAFAILLIYLLLSNTGGVENMDIGEGINLPMAASTEQLELTTIVKVQNGRYYLDNQELSIQQLATRLDQIRASQQAAQADGEPKRPELIIQADKNSNFEALDPVIKASSQVGFYVIKFAVLHEEGA